MGRFMDVGGYYDVVLQKVVGWGSIISIQSMCSTPYETRYIPDRQKYEYRALWGFYMVFFLPIVECI